MASWLVFIDTNILLDFYRLGGESAARQLSVLEKHKDALILTRQVCMEFLKNRQKVIVDSVTKIARPQKQPMPPILTDAQAAKMWAKHQKNADDQFRKIKKKLTKVLEAPAQNDPVFKPIKKIFSHEGEFNLRDDNALVRKIESRARRRFALGYPPRKQNDTSLGDAINWEWIIECALNCGASKDIVIVSRDRDYGVVHDGSIILNDFLLAEFKGRVSQKRKIILTNNLRML
jgi:PIN domain-containing protein